MAVARDVDAPAVLQTCVLKTPSLRPNLQEPTNAGLGAWAAPGTSVAALRQGWARGQRPAVHRQEQGWLDAQVQSFTCRRVHSGDAAGPGGPHLEGRGQLSQAPAEGARVLPEGLLFICFIDLNTKEQLSLLGCVKGGPWGHGTEVALGAGELGSGSAGSTWLQMRGRVPRDTGWLRQSPGPRVPVPSGCGDQQAWDPSATVRGGSGARCQLLGADRTCREDAEPCRTSSEPAPAWAPPAGEATLPGVARHSSLRAALATITSLDSSALKAPGLWATAVLVTSYSSLFRGVSLSLSNAAFE